MRFYATFASETPSPSRWSRQPSPHPGGHPWQVLKIEREQTARQVPRMQHGQAIRLVEVRGDLGEPAVRGVPVPPMSTTLHCWVRNPPVPARAGWHAPFVRSHADDGDGIRGIDRLGERQLLCHRVVVVGLTDRTHRIQ